jgi:cytosine deaminase
MNLYDPTEVLKGEVMKAGGFVNCHAHIDRAYTVTEENLINECEKFLTEKWKLVDKIKSESTEQEIYERMKHAFLRQKDLGVSSICSFIDVDSVIGFKAFNAATKLRKEMKNEIEIKIACQTLKGVTSPAERRMLESVLDSFDVIGSLPAADKDSDKHLDVVMSWAKDTGKKLHIHVDQLNTPDEDETSEVLSKISKYNLEGRVVGVHGISIASKKRSKRFEIYVRAKDKGMSFITCPSAWIDHRRSETLQPWHNSTTPVEEMLSFGLDVGLGTDNICDIYKPFSNGNMMNELKFILESCHIYDYKKLISMATNKNMV